MIPIESGLLAEGAQAKDISLLGGAGDLVSR